MREDRSLESAELGPRLDACMVDEQLACLAVVLERVGLPTSAVEREHDLQTGTLAQRCVSDAPLELGDQIPMAAEHERAIDAFLRHESVLLVEARDVDPRPARELHAGQRLTSPESQGIVVRAQRLRMVVRDGGSASGRDEL